MVEAAPAVDAPPDAPPADGAGNASPGTTSERAHETIRKGLAQIMGKTPTTVPTESTLAIAAPSEPEVTESALKGMSAPPGPQAAAAPADTTETPPDDVASPAAPDASEPTRRELPKAFRTAEYQRLYQADPNLRRRLRGTWFDPNISDDDKVVQIERRVQQARSSMATLEWQERERGRIRSQRDVSAAGEQVLGDWEREAQEQADDDRVQSVLADVLDVDPTDETFDNPDLGPNATREETLERVFDNFLDASPRMRVKLAQALANQEATHAAALQAKDVAHKLALGNAAETARAEIRGDTRSPPPVNGAPAPTGTRQREMPTMRTVRGNIGSYLRSRDA